MWSSSSVEHGKADMYVTIWRHGEAGMAASDRERELTTRGRDDVGFGCHQFHHHCEARGIPHPQCILYSPWQRTSQTAEIIASAFSHATREACEALIPGRSPDAVDPVLQRLLDEGLVAHALLVSHQPLVSTLVDHYLGEAGLVPTLVPGGQATLDTAVAAAGCARLCFSAQPPEYEAWN